ncbi:MAG TPA: hypothetical protein VFY73_05880 [Ideonella sp.]|uniref:hypothetical protein n=1 Tax=Ideonella sp. TaxID=1929293 RepID=UPI002E30EE4D|nr:hypothetical protein [Ideonella sp.]HEX5683550.1 hypothetical protein [Ideonella sp.]
MRADTTKDDAGRMHELRFALLFDRGRGITVPCDEQGCVDLDALSERMRISYFSARARMGRDFAYPVVRAVGEDVGSNELAAALICRSRGMY